MSEQFFKGFGVTLEKDLLTTAEYLKSELEEANFKLATYEYLDLAQPEAKAMRFALFRIMKDSECKTARRLAEAALKGDL